VAAVAGGSFSFGSVVRRGAAPTMTFIVSNVGTARLRTSTITVPSGFVVTKGLARYINAGRSDTLVVQMGTRAIGSYGGDLSIYSSDSLHSPYTLSISGSVIPGTVGNPGGGSGVTASMDGGTLTVTGTDGADDILVGGSVRAVTVTANGQTVAGGPFAGVSKIVVDAGSGNDRVTVTVPINSTLNGDDDNDTLTGGPGNDVLNGGAGDDVLVGGDGDDALNGGDGNDALTGGGGVDAMRGEAGNDSIDAADGIADTLVDGGPGNDVIQKDRVDPWTRT
jgi:Ca2+-binding RTX toxin-like protein